jgi:hypothetical protein
MRSREVSFCICFFPAIRFPSAMAILTNRVGRVNGPEGLKAMPLS